MNCAANGRPVECIPIGTAGRYRTNVWDYAGISSMSATRGEELAMHPTVKPVAMIEDAIKDCSRRRDIVLDIFAGSGSTLIAAEQSGHTAYLMEYVPAYCDTIIRRWQNHTGRQAQLEASGKTFEAVAEHRLAGQQLTQTQGVPSDPALDNPNLGQAAICTPGNTHPADDALNSSERTRQDSSRTLRPATSSHDTHPPASNTSPASSTATGAKSDEVRT